MTPSALSLRVQQCAFDGRDFQTRGLGVTMFVCASVSLLFKTGGLQLRICFSSFRQLVIVKYLPYPPIHLREFPFYTSGFAIFVIANHTKGESRLASVTFSPAVIPPGSPVNWQEVLQTELLTACWARWRTANTAPCSNLSGGFGQVLQISPIEWTDVVHRCHG